MKNGYKCIIVLLALILMSGLLGSCKDKKDENTLIVGFDAEFPPYGYKDDNGEYVGFDLDLAQEVCDRNGWELKKQPIEWDSKDMELNSGTIDCIWNGFTINGLEEKYTWSKAYVNNSQVVVVKADSGIKSLQDLKGKIVVVQSGSSALAAFEGDDATQENIELKNSFKELQQVTDYNTAFLNLETNAVNAICMDIGVAKYQLSQRGSKFVILDEVVSEELYGIGFKLGNTELRDKIQTTLDEMLEDGTFYEIAENWELSDNVCLGDEGTDEAYLLDTASESNKSIGRKVLDITVKLRKGMMATLEIFFFTLLFSMPLGLIICMLRMSKINFVRWIAKFYISVMRGTPLMLQLLVVFFGPYYIFGTSLSANYRFYAVIIGFSINYAAYFAEIYRSGIENIPRGQYEAAEVLGYNRVQTFWKIVFPQMVKRVLPPVTNEVITLVKDTSLAFALSYTEMFTLAKQMVAAEASVMPLFVAGLFYYIFNFLVAFVMEKIEKSMQYFE
jgi:polar amino acid transport system substrate-binding protein